MIQLTPDTLRSLRDRLRERGARPSMVSPGPRTSQDVLEAMRVVAEYAPLVEAMYLMMSADGKVATSEREVMRGALRELDDSIRSSHIESMLDEAAKRLSAEGRAARVRRVAEALGEDPVRCEVAFVLAAAVAFADGEIADEENDVLNDLAEALGIDEERANQLLDRLED